MKIDIAGPMLRAHVEGILRYTPVADGRELDDECGSVGTTLSNLARLVSTGREIVSLYARKGQVLVTFHTGETYLATGFQLPMSDDDLKKMATFVIKHNLAGSAKKWQDLARWYSNLSAEYEGKLSMVESGLPPADESGEIATDETTQLRIHQ